ncbi:MAG: hypothetical protein WBO10_15420 [Pyrinomonadaceae bacterium]
MKQCSNCKQIYYDDTLNYCLEDGTALDYAEEATVIRWRSQASQ